MTSDYVHIDVFTSQKSKRKGQPCGDVIHHFRDARGTYAILADGLGSGTQAHLSAHMFVQRLVSLLQSGFSPKDAFERVSNTLNNLWGQRHPWAAFCLARILKNGEVRAYCYESPPPVLVGHNIIAPLHFHSRYNKKALIHEASGRLKRGEGLLLVCDGIVQAGIGRVFKMGWDIEGLVKWLNREVHLHGAEQPDLPDLVVSQALEYWGEKQGDDCSALIARARPGVMLKILTGPPANGDHDHNFVQKFMDAPGIAIVCGGSTAKMVARIIKKPLEINYAETSNSLTPPSYQIKGITLVTEGVITLNQARNLMDEDLHDADPEEPAFQLAEFLQIADRVTFFAGDATNKGGDNIAFKQQGILPRKEVVQAIATALEANGKLVQVIKA